MKLSFRSKLFYGGGDFAINIMWQLTVFYLLFFYTDIFGLSPANAGLVFFLAKIWDAFTDPIMGYIADNTSTRWGKFRPYILFGSVPALIMIILCFTSPDLSQTGKFYWALFTYITFTTLYTIIAIPVGSLIPAMTQDRDERTSLASFRYLGASSGSIAVAVLTLPLVGLFSSPQFGFPIVVGCLAVLGAIFAFLCFFNTKEVYSKPYEETIGIKKVTKIKPKLSTTGGTSDARFIRKIAPCLEFGLVGKTMHKVDEAVSLTDLKKLSLIYSKVLKNYFK
mgnify:CR=1 FL=1